MIKPKTSTTFWLTCYKMYVNFICNAIIIVEICGQKKKRMTNTLKK